MEMANNIMSVQPDLPPAIIPGMESPGLPVDVPEQSPVLGLAAYCRGLFEKAKGYKESNLDARILDSARRREGQYDAEKLALIRAAGGSEMFFNLTDTKATALEAWLTDIYLSREERPWGLDPTPIPELPPEIEAGIVERVANEAAARAVQAQGTMSPKEIWDYTLKLREESLADLMKEARRRAESMESKLNDLFEEGHFWRAFADFLTDFCTYPLSIFKGPVFKPVKSLNYGLDGTLNVTTEIRPTWDVVDPMLFFPDPNARAIEESYLCEVVYIPRSLLAQMKGRPGWNDDELDAVLMTDQKTTSLTFETDMALLDNRDTSTNQGLALGMVQAVDFWGDVQGVLLDEWGMTGLETQQFYPVNVLLVGDHCVYAVLNPDPLGAKHHFTCSFRHKTRSIYGRSVSETMADVQDAVNACCRNLMDNMAIASGPQVMADVDALEASSRVDQMQPLMIWYYHGRELGTGTRKPVDFFQPNANADQLLHIAEYFESKADDRSLIPRYAHGNENVRGAGQTASGMSMLMDAATKSIRLVFARIGLDVLLPAITVMYNHLLKWDPDDSIKGDANIVPRGVFEALIRETVQSHQLEFLDKISTNQRLYEIIGKKGLSRLMRRVVDIVRLPEDIMPTEEEIAAQIEMEAQAYADQARAEQEARLSRYAAPAPAAKEAANVSTE